MLRHFDTGTGGFAHQTLFQSLDLGDFGSQKYWGSAAGHLKLKGLFSWLHPHARRGGRGRPAQRVGGVSENLFASDLTAGLSSPHLAPVCQTDPFRLLHDSKGETKRHAPPLSN